MKQLFLLICLAILGCQGGSKVAETAQESPFRGEAFEVAEVISAEDLLLQMADKEELKKVTVKGTVTGVCQKKGCWMTLAAEGGDDIMVKFKDYDFFMPLDLTGEIVMQGRAFKQLTSVDELRHYAEDAGESPEAIAAITEPKAEIQFEASGVKIAKN